MFICRVYSSKNMNTLRTWSKVCMSQSELYANCRLYSESNSDSKKWKHEVKVKHSTKKKQQNIGSLLEEVTEELKTKPDSSSRIIQGQLLGQLTLINNKVQIRRDGEGGRFEGAKSQPPNKKNWSGKRQTKGEFRSREKIMSVSQFVERFQANKNQDRSPIIQQTIDAEKVNSYINTLMNNKSRLGMFNPPKQKEHSVDEKPNHKTAIDWWDECQRNADREGRVVKNQYQEMMDWMIEGNLLQFPVGNEVGMEDEQDVPFYKHIFLHEHLDDRFPKQGPVDKFMEAVILGLSKNSYLTVAEKEDHINWFKNYFNEKYETLKTLGLGAISNNQPK
uniref:28S ribosomal protein S31, mitochondrial-like n=1 Tax=Styela clava TaxID=7725 RepID=UPI00193A466E|nr:28S ribosomal protein S31, mitochondrial-like [Styela clava]